MMTSRYFCSASGFLIAGCLAALILSSAPASAQDSTGAVENKQLPDQSSEGAVEGVSEQMVLPAVEPEVTDAASDRTNEVMQRLTENLPGIAFSEVTQSTIPGLYEVTAGGQIYYVDEAAQYLFDGNLIRLSDRANLTDVKLGKIHMAMIQQLDEQDMLIYKAEEESDRNITVFTDISCGYCRRLHAEIDTLLEEGVNVRYLLFPRAGLGSQGHKDLESVWCADNPQDAMTNAKAGGEIEAKSCDNPIEKHVALAESLGLRGTPLIYTDSGEKIPGYREASALVTSVNDTTPMVDEAVSDQ